MRNGYLLSEAKILEFSITSSCFILIALCPISVLLLMQRLVFWLVVSTVGIPRYVQLGRKSCSICVVLEIPVASKLGTPRYFAPKPHVIRRHNLRLIISMVLLQNRIWESWNPTQLPKQPPSLDSG